MDEAVAAFAWDRDEYLRTVRRSVPRRLLVTWLLASAAFVLAGITLTLRHRGWGPILIGLGLAYVVFGIWFVRTIGTRTWAQPGTQGPRRLVVSDAGIREENPAKQSTSAWRMYTVCEEWDDCYYLRPNPRAIGWGVPKRAFATAQDEAAFRRLVRAHTRARLRASPLLDGGAAT